MGPRCPKCHASSFTYRALIDVHPWNDISDMPAKITCPSCHEALRVTATSRLWGGIAFVVIMFGIGLTPAATRMTWTTWGVVLAVLAGFFLYSIVWASIVQLKPWTPRLQYWLPKSRVLGYSVYLMIPLAVIALLLYLAMYFRWGM